MVPFESGLGWTWRLGVIIWYRDCLIYATKRACNRLTGPEIYVIMEGSDAAEALSTFVFRSLACNHRVYRRALVYPQ